MPVLSTAGKTNRPLFIAIAVLMFSAAFFQGYKTTHDLHYAFDVDFDRDISFARGLMNGHYGQDPNYKGEYLWYNPLLFSVEAAISKITSAPLEVVATRAGVYLNLLGPLAFFFMGLYFFGWEIALASLFSLIYIQAKMVNGGETYGYSPWLYPFCFAQFIYYINLILCYKAFESKKYLWFSLLGLGIGISFLTHTAPTLLVILILISVQSGNILKSVRQKSYAVISKYLFQGITTFVFFILAALPLLYYVAFKYHMHTINRTAMEYTEGFFYLSRFKDLIKANLSFSLLVAIFGLGWFYKNFHHPLVRSIIFNWLIMSVLMYFYATAVAFLGGDRYKIYLPGTVPSFHYYFYIKTLQSVFFGFGFVAIFSRLVRWIENFFTAKKTGRQSSSRTFLYAFILAGCVMAIFPSYSKRPDFTMMRTLSLAKENNKDRMDMYHYILQYIPEDKVILCEREDSIPFIVVPAARKMVCTETTFSNPFVDYQKRENDRQLMLSYIKDAAPPGARALFKSYDVEYVLVASKRLPKYKMMAAVPLEPVYQNETYAFFRLKPLP